MRALLLLSIAMATVAVCQSSTYGPAANPAAYQYRLVGGPGPTMGRLEVRPNATAPWGTVCDDMFDTNDAIVACNSLGFGLGPAQSFSMYGGGSESQPIYMDDVYCSTKLATTVSATLAQCNFHNESYHNCQHIEDVGIRCQLENYNSTYQWRLAGTSYSNITSTTNGFYLGRLETRPNASAPWGTVCGDSFNDQDALVACKTLGLTGITRAEAFIVGDGAGPVWLDGVQCGAHDQKIEFCPRGYSYSAWSMSCPHARDVGVLCVAGSASVPTANLFEYRLTH